MITVRRILQRATTCLTGVSPPLFLIFIIAFSIGHSSGHVIRRSVVGFPAKQDVPEQSMPTLTLLSENPQNTEDHQRQNVQVQVDGIIMYADANSTTTGSASDNNELPVVDITIDKRENEDMKHSKPDEKFSMKHSSYVKESSPKINSLEPFMPNENDFYDCNRVVKTLCNKIHNYPRIYIDKLLGSVSKPAYFWTDVLEEDVQNKPVHTFVHKKPVEEILLVSQKSDNDELSNSLIKR